MNTASYNITNGRLKVWFSERLPKPEYERAKRIGFVYWFGSKCLTCVWRPEAEDFITEHGIDIEEDDSADDTEARVERFGGYAANAEASAESRETYLNERANTERRRRLALSGATNETEKAAYWHHRIERSIRHAKFKESPGLIARRIDELERRLRQQVASCTPHEVDGKVIRYQNQVIVGPKGGRGSRAVDESRLPALKAYAQRWIDHLENRLIYERACLAAAGGVQAAMAMPGGVEIEVGGAIKAAACERGQWLEVVKVSTKTIMVFQPFVSWQRYRSIPRSWVSEIGTKLRVDSGEIYLPERAPKIEKVKAEKATNRAGERPEKFGAFGSSNTFHDDRTKDVERWYLITKVNQVTVDYFYSYTETILKADKTTEKRVRYFVKKENIKHAGRFISASEVKKKHPELLKEWTDLQQRIAANKAAKAAEAQKESAA